METVDADSVTHSPTPTLPENSALRVTPLLPPKVLPKAKLVPKAVPKPKPKPKPVPKPVPKVVPKHLAPLLPKVPSSSLAHARAMQTARRDAALSRLENALVRSLPKRRLVEMVDAVSVRQSPTPTLPGNLVSRVIPLLKRVDFGVCGLMMMM